MRKCSRVARSRSQRKSKSNWKPAACNWKRAGGNSKPAENSLKPLAEQASPRTPVEVRGVRQLRSRRPNSTNMMSTSTMSTNRDQMIGWVVLSICAAGFLSACATNPPPLPPGNPADPQVRAPAKIPRNLLARDETTLAIEKQLSATEAYAESAEKMEHDMQNMPGMQHGEMQHGGMKMEGQSQMQHKGDIESEKKAVADEMKKTSDEMKKTSDAMKQKSDEMKPGAIIYACPMHPQIKADKTGKCPICCMTLKKRESGQ